MIRSRKHGFFIIEVPKTGTVSMHTALKDLNDIDRDLPRHLAAHRARRLMPEDWKNLTTYGVIREPFGWITSYFKYLNDQEEAGNTDRPVAGVSFEDFVRASAAEKSGGPKTPWFKLGSQAERLCHRRKDRLIVNRLLCFDFLTEEFNRLQVRHLGSRERTLERRNVSKKRTIQTDDNLRSFVEEHWALDLALWKSAYEKAETRQKRRQETRQEQRKARAA